MKHIVIPTVPFGTAGFRAHMVPGAQGINLDTISCFAQAAAETFKHSKFGKRVVISYDPRYQSKEFAYKTGCIFAGNGYEAYMTDKMMPTPFLSFLCRHLKVATGIMITASHNPKNDNGFKIYEPYGGQVLNSEKLLLENLKNIEAIYESDEILTVPSSAYEAYFKEMEEVIGKDNLIKNHGSEIKLCYSAFCGAGLNIIPDFLHKAGFPNLYKVDNQCIENPEFAGMNKPNPELVQNLIPLIELLKSTNADLGFATDPDADRIAFVDKKGTCFTGNEIACIVAEHLLKSGKRGTIFTTFVSSDLIEAQAKKYNVPIKRFQTGFRYISHAIETLAEEESFLLGFEESLGYKCYLGGSYDKDAPHMAILVSKIALQAKREGKTLTDLLDELNQTYGYYKERQVSIEYGTNGTQEHFLSRLKQKKGDLIANREILKREEGIDGKALLKLTLKGNIVLLGRFSGTETKYKFYIKHHAPPSSNLNEIEKELQDFAKQLANEFQ